MAKLQAGELEKEESEPGTTDTGVNTSYIDPEEQNDKLKLGEKPAGLDLKRTKSHRIMKQRPNLNLIGSYKNKQTEQVMVLRAKVSIAKRSVAIGERPKM